MPSVAPNFRAKRLLSSATQQQPSSDTSSPQKKPRVQFDDRFKVAWPEKETGIDSMLIEAIDDDNNDELDFTLSVGDNGDIDCFITKGSNNEKHQHDLVSIDRPMSPIEGCKHCLTDGLCSCSSDLGDELFHDSTITEQEFLQISINACNRATSPVPLITPPASPKRVNTVSKNGDEEKLQSVNGLATLLWILQSLLPLQICDAPFINIDGL